VLLSAGLAFIDLAAELFGTASLYILHGLTMPRRHPIPIGIEVSLTMQPKDIGYLQHG